MLVVEVRYDQVTGRRFRHGTGFVRWRPDKAPRQCTFEQLAPELRPSQLEELFGDMSLLFDAPLIAGLDYREEFISAGEERALIDRLDDARPRAVPLPRLARQSQDAELRLALRLRRRELSRRPSRFPTGCSAPRQGCRLRRTEPDDFVHALLARYDPGAGIGWHRDRDVFDQVVGISLSTPAILRSASGRRRVQPREPRCRAALRLSAVGRSALRMGAQHRARRRAALLNHLPDACRDE